MTITIRQIIILPLLITMLITGRHCSVMGDDDLKMGEKRLFKDRINKRDNVALAEELLSVVDLGEDSLKDLLFGTESQNYPETYN